MIYKVGQLKSAEPALVTLTRERLPIQIALQVSKYIREIAVQVKNFDELRNNLVVKYGKPIPGKEDDYEVTPENMDSFLKDIQPYLEQEVDLPIEKIKISELPSDVRLTPTEAAQLEYFLE